MRRRHVIGTVLFGVVACAEVFGFRSWVAARKTAALFSNPISAPASAVLDDEGHLVRRANSTVTVVEFADYQCPPCKRAQLVLKSLEDSKSGCLPFAFEFRNNPLPIHPFAAEAAATAEAAGETVAFWKIHDKLFDEQQKLNKDYLSRLRKEFGISDSVFTGAKSKVEKDQRAAENLRLSYTPAFFLIDRNGNVYKIPDVTDIPAMVGAAS